MSKQILKPVALAVLACASWSVQGQTIEKMKLTDGSLTCAQLYAESQQMEAIMRGGVSGAPGMPANLYGMNTQHIANQAQAAGQQLAQDPQVMALAQQYAAKAQAGTMTAQEQQQYAMLMMQNPAVQKEMQRMTGVVLGEMQSSGAIQQAMNQALSHQGHAPVAGYNPMAQAGGVPYPNTAANTGQAIANAQALGLFGGATQNNTQGILQANNLNRQDMVLAQQMMLQSKDIKIRAAASDPQSVAQFAAVMRNPQLATAVARAQQAGVNPAIIQSQINAASLVNPALIGSASSRSRAEDRMAQTAAANQATGMAIANQGQRYQQLVASGMPWQQALAQAQAETGAGAAAAGVPAANTQDAGKALASNLFGALAGAKGGSAGGQQAASLLGSLFAGAQKPQAPAVAPVAVAPTTGNPALAAQAQARKEHVTSMFLSKGCKLSDVQR